MSIVKITTRGKTILAISVGENEYLDENGDTYKTNEVSRTRNISPEVREAFENLKKAYLEEKKLRDKFEKIQEEYRTNITLAMQKEKEAIQELRMVRGKLSWNEFAKAFVNALPCSMKNEMELYGYSVSTPYGISYDDNHMYISRSQIIQKYFRKASLVYEEYDGCILMADKAETYPEYQKYLKEHSRPLHGIKPAIKECLYMGDKDSLCYSGTYELQLTEPLTKEYAEKLAKKFVK